MNGPFDNKKVRVTWKSTILSKDGFAIEQFLNIFNFQPGKFFVVDLPNTHEVRIYFVEKEEEL